MMNECTDEVDVDMPFSRIRNLKEIWEHRFNRELYAGTLPHVTFMAFLSPDVFIYLPRYTQAMNAISDRFLATNNPVAEQFKQLAVVNEAYIQYIHDQHPELQTQLARTPGFFQPANTANNMIFHEYADHLIKEGSLAEAVARVTPCLWLYRELGLQMDLTSCSPDHRYLPWLKSYQDPDYVGLADDLVATLNTLYKQTSDPVEKEKIMVAFQESLDFDLAIFESLHPEEPVAQNTNFI